MNIAHLWRCAVSPCFAVALVCLLESFSHATVVRFETSRGNIDFRLFHSATPLHTANLLNYVNSNRYDGTFVHRNAKTQTGSDFVIQGGGYKIDTSLLSTPLESGWSRVTKFATVPNEPGISNLRGTIALAKLGNDPNSGTSEWFINLGNNSFLDLPANNEFTVFGRLIANGLSVADEIAGLGRVNARVTTTDNQGNPVVFNSAFTDVPVNDVNLVVSQQDVFNSDVVLLNDAIILNFLEGDYSFDNSVDGADLGVWAADFGSTLLAEADGNGNGIVDGGDFLGWQRTFGDSAPLAASQAVPEPGSCVLAVVAMTILLLGGRTR